MTLHFRKRVKFGPFIINVGKNGVTSWTFKLGPWSRNSRTKTHRVNLPGPLSWESKRKEK